MPDIEIDFLFAPATAGARAADAGRSCHEPSDRKGGDAAGVVEADVLAALFCIPLPGRGVPTRTGLRFHAFRGGRDWGRGPVLARRVQGGLNGKSTLW